jgi:hypothetical protein
MTVYDPRSSYPDDFAPGSFAAVTTFSFRTAAELLNDPSTFPLSDDARTVGGDGGP